MMAMGPYMQGNAHATAYKFVDPTLAETSLRLVEAGGFRMGRDPERYLKSLEIDVKDRNFVDVLCQMDSLLAVVHKLC